MASSSGVQSFQQPFQCKECGLALNSAESLEVHLQYHQENLMQQWAVKAQGSGEEKNNNMTKAAAAIKREFTSSNSVAADSSDMQKKSPDYHRNTPEAIYGHPPTPQSYQSASSPYQNHENSTFSPNFQNFPLVKSECNSPSSQQQQPHYQNSFSNFSEQQQFFGMDANGAYAQDMNIAKHSVSNSFRYHPYGAQPFERPKSQGAAASVSPAYPPQPTPSPSPKQCDKCGYVCESAAQLIEHNNLTHSNNPQVQSQYPQNNQHFMFDQQTSIKEEDTSQSEILDLDSHKVVHPVWAEGKEEDKRPNGESNNPHSVSAMLNSWPSPSQQQQQPNMFQGEHNMFINESGDQKMFSNLPNMSESKMFSADQKLFQPHQMGNQNFINNGVSSSNPEMGTSNQQSYRSFEHLPNPPSSVISSTQVPQVPTTNAGPPPNSGVKGANWKSNEARRPKTYQCTACNKWFTSSGHLKRHYNTTLHKNAVKSSGQPDPATLPISAHHHPSRDSASQKEDNRANSGSPREDGKDDSNGMGSQFDNRLGSMPGLLQHPPNGPYDRQGMHHTPPMHSPIQHHTPLGNPSPLGGHMMQNSGFPNMPNGSPPNGDAGLSPPDSRGLLSMAPPPHSFNMMSQPPMMPPMEATQFQMYPNGSAPHVSQATDTTSNLSTTGELHFVVQNETQPLPSFAQIQAHRFGIGFANVGGLESVTAPASFTYYTTENFDLNEAARNLLFKEDDGSPYKLAVLTRSDVMQPAPEEVNQLSQYSPTSSNNNNNEKLVINYEEIVEDLEEHTNVTYLTPSSSQPAVDPLAQPLVIATDAQGESKENYEENTATGSPRISSTTVANQDESKTKCFDCDKVFNRPCYLTQHNKTCHNGDKPYKCPRCGKRFSDEETYKEHTRKHAGDKPHKCDMCPKMFNHKTDLRRHLCCHTGRKPYACEMCGKGFIRKDHMVKHMDTHARKKEKLGAMRS